MYALNANTALYCKPEFLEFMVGSEACAYFILYRYIPLNRGSVHPLQDVALRITSRVVSLSGISAPSDSFHLHDVVSPSLRLSTS